MSPDGLLDTNANMRHLLRAIFLEVWESIKKNIEP